MRDPLAQLIRFKRRGQMPRAVEWNAIVQILRRDQMDQGLYFAGPFRLTNPTRNVASTRVRHVTTAAVEEFGVVAVQGYNNSLTQPVLTSEPYAPDGSIGSGNINCVINDKLWLATGESGWCHLGSTPCLAQTQGVIEPGRRCGPRAGQSVMIEGASGYHVISPGPLDWGNASYTAWVLRDGGVGFGEGKLASDQGGGIWTLDNVYFYQGLDTANGARQLTVANPYGDTYETGLHATFIWSPFSNRYEIVTVACPA